MKQSENDRLKKQEGTTDFYCQQNDGRCHTQCDLCYYLKKEGTTAYCLDCNKPYSDFALDTVLSDEQWELIHPEKNGLLCVQCIINRAEKLNGIIRVDMKLIQAEPAKGDRAMTEKSVNNAFTLMAISNQMFGKKGAEGDKSDPVTPHQNIKTHFPEIGDKSELSEENIAKIILNAWGTNQSPGAFSESAAKAIYQAISPIIEENKELKETSDKLRDALIHTDIELKKAQAVTSAQQAMDQKEQQITELKKTISGYQIMIENRDKHKYDGMGIPPPEVKK